MYVLAEVHRSFLCNFLVLSDTKVEFLMNFHLSCWLVTQNNYTVVFSQAQIQSCAHCQGTWGSECVAAFIPNLGSGCG